MKKQLRLSTAAILATSVVAAAVPTNIAEAATYKDVSVKANYYQALQELSKQGIITGFADGTFKPNAKITRGQVAKILTRMLDLKSSNSIQFSDLSKDHDFYPYASAVVGAGYMQKKNGKFNAKQTITRNEYAEILTKAFQLQATSTKLSFLDVNSQYQTAISAVYAAGIMKGVNSVRFNGVGEVTRSQLVATIHKAMKLQQGGVGSLPNVKTTTFTIAGIGTNTLIDDDDKKYTVSTELQKLFSSANAAILQEAEVEAVVENGRITRIVKLTVYNSATTWRSAFASRQFDATFSNTTARTLDGFGGRFSFPIIVDGPNITLQNMTLPTVQTGTDATGTFNLQGVTINNRLIVGDSYSRTLLLNIANCGIPYVELNRDRITVQGTSKLPKVFITDKAYDVTFNTAVGHMQVQSDSYFTMFGTGSIDTLQLLNDINLYLSNAGTIGRLQIDHADAWIRLNSNSRILEASIPINTTYEDVFSGNTVLSNYISKIYYPNSTLNLLADKVVKPTKEQIAFERAVDNVIKSHQHTVLDKRLTVRTNFNEISQAMKTLSFEQQINLVDGAAGLSEIPISYYKNGVLVGEKTVAVSALQSGISLEELFNSPKTFENLMSNSSVSYAVQFETERELKIRSTVFVRGVGKNSAESIINDGNEQIISNAYNVAIKSHATSLTSNTSNTIQATLGLNQIGDIIKPSPVAHIIKLHSELPTSVTELPLTIRKGTSVLFNGNVSVEDLKAGLLTSTLTSMPAQTFADFANNSSTAYTFQFNTPEEFDVSVSLAVDGKVKVPGNLLTINDGVTQQLADLPVTYNAESLSGKGVQFTFNSIATAIPTTIESLPIDVKLALSDEITTSETVQFAVTANGKLGTAEVTVAQLKAGVNILQHTTFDNTYTPLTLKDLVANKVINIELQTPLQGKLTATSVVSGTTKGTTSVNNVFDVELVEALNATNLVTGTGTSTVTEGQTIAKGFTLDVAPNGLRIKTKFGAGAPAASAEQNLDAKIVALNGISAENGTKKVYATIYFNGTLVKAYAPITYTELLSGKMLSHILGQQRVPVNTHAENREDTWDIVVHNFDESVVIKAELMSVGSTTATILAEATNTFSKVVQQVGFAPSLTFTENIQYTSFNTAMPSLLNTNAAWATEGNHFSVARIEGVTLPAANTITFTSTHIGKNHVVSKS